VADVTTAADLKKLELLLQAGNSIDALTLVTERLESDPANRHLRLYSLLTRIIAFGSEPAEAEIDALRHLNDLSESERALVMEILDHGLRAAVRSGDAGKVWVYRRSLRRVAAGLPMDRPLSPLRSERPKPPVDLTPGDLATVRDVFLAEPNGGRARAARRSGHIANALKESRRSLGLLGNIRGNLAVRLAATCTRARRDGRAKFAALRDGFAANRARVAFIVATLVMIGAWGALIRTSKPTVNSDVKPNTSPRSLLPSPLASSRVDKAASERAGADDATTTRATAQPSAELHAAKPAPGDTKDSPVGARAALRGRDKKFAPPPADRSAVLHATQTVSLRGEPRYGAPKGQALASGARLSVVESRGSWVKVRSEADGSVGYVRQEFLARRSSPRK
jgi:hypothetical protein